MARVGEMREVDLVEDGPTPEPPEQGRRSHRRGLLAAAVVGVVVLALLVGQWRLDARREAALAALADVPGVLAPFDGPLEVVDRFDQERMPTAFGPSGTLEVAVDGSQSYVWRAKGGAEVWTTPLSGPSPALVRHPDLAHTSSCQPDLGERRPDYLSMAGIDRVVCLVGDGGVTYEDDAAVRIPPTLVQVTVLATADGSVQAQWAAPDGEGLALLPGVAVVETPDDGGLVVTARDVGTGEANWTHRIAGDADTDDPLRGFVSTEGSYVLVDLSDGRLVVLSSEGDLVLEALARENGYVQCSLDAAGRLIVTTMGGGAPSTTVVTRDGDRTRSLEIEAEAVPLTVDDGSVDLVLVSGTDGLEAWDPATGERRWSADGDVSSALVLDGRVFTLTIGGAVALDARTGERVWEAARETGASQSGLMTDGRHILVNQDSSSEFVALDRETGAVAFRTSYPEGVGQLFPVGRHLVGFDDAAGDMVLVG